MKGNFNADEICGYFLGPNKHRKKNFRQQSIIYSAGSLHFFIIFMGYWLNNVEHLACSDSILEQRRTKK